MTRSSESLTSGPLILGGWLHVWFGWRGPFAFLGLLGLGLWGACRYARPESLPRSARLPFHPGHLFRAYVETSRHPAFVLSCLALAFGGGGFLLYVATAPDVALTILQLAVYTFGFSLQGFIHVAVYLGGVPIAGACRPSTTWGMVRA